MRILITGADGFAGRHLAHELADGEHELHGTCFRAINSPAPAVTYHPLDLRDESAVADLIGEVAPDQVYHLAAMANVAQSYSAAWATLENNIHAQVNLFVGCLNHQLAPRMVIVSSGDIYGDQLSEAATENLPFRPSNPYSVSKVTQDMLALQFHLTNQLPIMRARPFNHLGPGQSRGFVAPDIAMQIAQIEAGLQEPVIRVGALTPERDFSDVRDVVRAYHLIMERGTPGTAYNIASGTPRTIQSLLDQLLAHSSAEIGVQVDAARLRPGSVSRSWGSAARLHAETGWQPMIPLEQSLLDVLNDWRERVQATLKESK